MVTNQRQKAMAGNNDHRPAIMFGPVVDSDPVPAIAGIAAGARLRKLVITLDALFDVLALRRGATYHKIEVVEGLPEDVLFLGSAYDPCRQTAMLLLAHPSFVPLPGKPTWADVPMVYIRHYVQYRNTLAPDGEPLTETVYDPQ